MPDRHSVEFWQDMAARYGNQPNVFLGLYNEPFGTSWNIWRDGGEVQDRAPRWVKATTNLTYIAVGMQPLYDAVRAAGARNIITIGGLDWAYDLSGLEQGFAVRGTNILYETHPYPSKKEWDKSFGDVSRHFPVFVGEWGGGTNDLNYGRELIEYIRQHDLPWTVWCFHPACRPAMLKNWDYEPSVFGQFVKDLLAADPAAQASAHGAN
jgi:hypothetical protein